jgi:thiamine biosynthesis lipoprotein
MTALVALAVAISMAGCSTLPSPVTTKSRDVLGTTVSVAVYRDDAGAAIPIESAFAAMSRVEKQLSSYDASSAIAAFNRTPSDRHALPPDALLILQRTGELGVSAQFSPALFGVTSLYDFGGAGTVPTEAALSDAVRLVHTFRVEGGTAFFAPLDLSSYVPGTPLSAPATPGLDFGGASKGLALDLAVPALRGLPGLITAGSSTLAVGHKPDGEPWRVGVEDPREVGRVVAVVSSEGTLSVSTSGDYQTYFDRGGVRYHHILDPSTGLPARGMRSLTVFGTMSALDADILSTALFVMGRDRALDYARTHAIGIYLVDDSGAPASFVPASYSITLSEETKPKP